MIATSMRFLALALACTALCAAEVVVLTDENFEHLTQASTGATTGDWFVKFYAPWCGHCKKMAPTWDELAERLEGTYVNVAKVSVTENRAIGKRFGIKGYPTIKFFSKGQMYSYKGPRTIEAFETFANGGYARADKEPVPGKKGLSEEVLDAFMDIARQLAARLKGDGLFILVIGIMIGVIFTSLIFVCLAPPAPLPPPKAKSS